MNVGLSHSILYVWGVSLNVDHTNVFSEHNDAMKKANNSLPVTSHVNV